MTTRAYSTVPDVYLKLFQLLRDRPGLAGVQVEAGHPGQQQEAESLTLSTVETPEQDAATLGTHHGREERYVIYVVVDVLKPGGDKLDVIRRAFQIARELEGLLREDDGLGGVFHGQGRQGGHAQFDGFDLVQTEDVDGSAWWTHMECRVAVMARI